MKKYKSIFALILFQLITNSISAQQKDSTSITSTYIENLSNAWSDGNLEVLNQNLAETMTLHGPIPDGNAGFAGNRHGKKAYITHLKQIRESLGGDSSSIEIKEISNVNNKLTITYEVTGKHSKFYLGVKPTQKIVKLSIHDTYVFEGNKIIEAWHSPDRFSLIDKMTSNYSLTKSFKSLKAEEVVAFKPGAFPESLVEHPNGDIFVTLQMDGQIWKIRAGEASLFYQFPKDFKRGYLDGPSTLNIDKKGKLVAVVISGNEKYQGVWSFDVKNGVANKMASLPTLGNHLNGSTIDKKGNIYIADATLGIIWKVKKGHKKGEIWLRDQLLAKRSFVGIAPAANGIQYYKGSLYVSVSDKEQILKISLDNRGNPSPPTVYVKGLGGDDFAIDKDGTFYVTTHAGNSIVQVSPKGNVLGTIATIKEGIIGSTAAIIVYDKDGNKWLYVTNDGGFFGSPGRKLTPNLTRTLLEK